MKILLDECLPHKLKSSLPNHHVVTVQESGWGGLKNGVLIARAAGQFDVFITLDRGLLHQQNLTGSALIIIVLRAANNRLDTLAALMPKVLNHLETASPGEIFHVPVS
jgi:predicted nuclease of predicted toxin-antitoxin system